MNYRSLSQSSFLSLSSIAMILISFWSCAPQTTYANRQTALTQGYPELAAELAQTASSQRCRLAVTELYAAFQNRGIEHKVEQQNIVVGMLKNGQARVDEDRVSTLIMTTGVCRKYAS